MPQDNRGYSTGPGSGVDINIGATPGMSANARAVLQQMMSRPSDNWGSAVSRLGAAFALGHAEKKARTVKEKKTAATMARRQSWAESLGGGMSARELAIKDPAFLGDTEFQKRWAGTAPPPEVEHWNDEDSPYGKGGFGQRSSTTALIRGWQGPVPTPRSTAAQDRRRRGQTKILRRHSRASFTQRSSATAGDARHFGVDARSTENGSPTVR